MISISWATGGWNKDDTWVKSSLRRNCQAQGPLSTPVTFVKFINHGFWSQRRDDRGGGGDHRDEATRANPSSPSPRRPPGVTITRWTKGRLTGSFMLLKLCRVGCELEIFQEWMRMCLLSLFNYSRLLIKVVFTFRILFLFKLPEKLT